MHLGSGSGSVLTCVLADDPDDFLRLLAIGYDEVCWLYEEQFAEPPDREDGHDPVNRPFVDWVTARGLGVPSQARELVPNPAQMTDEDNPDPFWQWLRRVCRW